MGSNLNPYLSFRSEARAAMEFYQSVLGGELNVFTFAESGYEEGGDGVMHSSLQTPSGYTIFASDTPAPMDLPTGSQVTLSISGDGDSADELRGYFAALAEGGEVRMPLGIQSWGDEFGMITDKFGIAWMVNISGAR